MMYGNHPYIETAADHQMTAFLSRLTPSKVLRDRELTFTKEERQRQRFLRDKAAVERAVAHEREVQIAMQMAREMRQGNG